MNNPAALIVSPGVEEMLGGGESFNRLANASPNRVHEEKRYFTVEEDLPSRHNSHQASRQRTLRMILAFPLRFSVSPAVYNPAVNPKSRVLRIGTLVTAVL